MGENSGMDTTHTVAMSRSPDRFSRLFHLATISLWFRLINLAAPAFLILVMTVWSPIRTRIPTTSRYVFTSHQY